MKAILSVPFLLVVALVVYAEDSFSAFTIWNALPVAIGFGVLWIGLRSRGATAAGCIAFAVSVTVLVALFHLAWLFDWGSIATGSSTSALAFIFVPFWVIVFAAIIGLVAWGVGRVVLRRASDTSA
jgi:hypothetical protein